MLAIGFYFSMFGAIVLSWVSTLDYGLFHHSQWIEGLLLYIYTLEKIGILNLIPQNDFNFCGYQCIVVQYNNKGCPVTSKW